MSEREKIDSIIADALFNYREEPRSGQLWGRERADARAAAARAALEAAGYVIAPREPSWGMQIAGRDAILSGLSLERQCDRWRDECISILSKHKTETE